MRVWMLVGVGIVRNAFEGVIRRDIQNFGLRLGVSLNSYKFDNFFKMKKWGGWSVGKNFGWGGGRVKEI